MKTFHCTHCQNLIFFENVRCLNCERSLAFLPDRGLMAALTPSPDGLWRTELSDGESQGYRLCAHYNGVSVCNWVIPADDPSDFCRSCRLNQVIPDLSSERNAVAWFRLEVAKRRMLYTLLGFGLPVIPKSVDAVQGLAFEFLEDYSDGDAKRVLTGHDNGLITLNIAEADDVHREKERTLQKEPYRTLLGHFRHEIGHYFWDRLVAGGPLLEPFRTTFGDERADYQAALQRHYRTGRRPIGNAVSSARMPPCTVGGLGGVLGALHAYGGRARDCRRHRARPAAPAQRRAVYAAAAGPLNRSQRDFDSMIEPWLSLTYVLNNLSRGWTSRRLPVRALVAGDRQAALHS